MKDYTQRIKIEATPDIVYKLLTESDFIKRWSLASAKMKPLKDFEFNMLDERVSGKNLILIKDKTIIQEWYLNNVVWTEAREEGFISIVRITLSLSDEGITELDLKHTDIPSEEFSFTKSLWKKEILGKIKEFFEFNKL